MPQYQEAEPVVLEGGQLRKVMDGFVGAVQGLVEHGLEKEHRFVVFQLVEIEIDLLVEGV